MTNAEIKEKIAKFETEFTGSLDEVSKVEAVRVKDDLKITDEFYIVSVEIDVVENDGEQYCHMNDEVSYPKEYIN